MTPLNLVHLLPILDQKLLELLETLSPNQWQQQTIAKEWTVKDVAAHLLDGNIRTLSMLRDNHYGQTPVINDYHDLTAFLNHLNADWVRAMKRVSPAMLISLLKATGKPYCDYYASLDPLAIAGFAVSWAGENESTNQMHIAREYTEKWLHQQQIRDAVNMPGLLTKEFFYPFIHTFMIGLPHTYRDVEAEQNTSIQVTIPGEMGGSWWVTRKENGWTLNIKEERNPASQVFIDPDIAWRLFSKSLRPEAVMDNIKITGDQTLGVVALSMVSVMA